MKCMNCGKKEANCFYSENINGFERHTALCSECAEKSGLFERRRQFAGFDGFDDFFGEKSFGGMIGEMNRLMNTMEKSFFEPFFGNMIEDKTEKRSVKEEKKAEKAEEKKNAGICKNELQSLKKQLKAAINEENFEQAAVLRDKIRALDKKSA